MHATRDWRPGLRRALFLIATPYAIIIAVGLGIATPGIYMMGAARAYVTGEGLYSKAQKRAALHLTRYAHNRDPAEWRAYETQIALPRADGEALAALERDPPDHAAAREAFLRARNHADDVPGMIRLFAWASWMPEMNAAIGVWKEGDANIGRLDDAARTLHATLQSASADPQRIANLLTEISDTDARLSDLEERFSSLLGAGARRLRTIVVATAWGAGSLLLVIGVIASRRIADAIRRRDEVFRSMIERAHDIITILDAQGRILYNSPAVVALLGHRPEEMEQRSCIEWVHPDDRERVAQSLAEALHDASSAEYRFLAKDGSWRTFASRGGPFPLAGGAMGIVVNSRDVTERRQLERRLADAERMESIGRLAGGVAHDFNNLITVIAGSVTLARGASSLSPELRADLDVVDKACQRAGQLTGQLLTFARRQVLEPTVVDVNVVLRELDEMLRHLFDDSIELTLDLCPGGVAVRADRAQLDRLILNLTANAAEAMHDGGAVTISTQRVELTERSEPTPEALAPGPYVQIDVVNTGEAIRDEVRAHVFEPFFTTKTDGTGLGLATCYGIVRQNGGSIHVEGQPGKGTRFWILWPRANAAELRTATPVVAPVLAGSETLLYVEDEPPLRRVVTRILERAGYRILEASNGYEALELAESEPAIALLLTDVSMPGMNGRELADRFRLLRPGLPVIFMSGYTEDPALKDQVGARDAHFVQKPFDPDALQERLRRILDEHQAARASGGREARR